MDDRSSSAVPREAERRTSFRYPVAADLDYRLVSQACGTCSGSAKTVNISSEGILFESLYPIKPGEPIEVSVAWPAPASQQPRIRLRAVGRTVWAQENRTAVIFEQWAFQTH